MFDCPEASHTSPNQNILALDRPTAHVAAYRERVGPAGWFGLEPCFPIAEAVSFRRHSLAMEPDRHHFSGPGPTPNANGAVTLHHSVVRK